jgi:cytosine/uracil/thiamine/allantoin permease
VAPSPLLYSPDLAPVPAAQRSFSAWDMASLWIGLVVSVSSWYLAGGLVELGMAWYQGLGCVLLANTLVLVPMVLVGQIGVKYGVSQGAVGWWGGPVFALRFVLHAQESHQPEVTSASQSLVHCA